MIRNYVGGIFYAAEADTRFSYYPETFFGGWGHWTPTLWVDGRDEQTSDAGDVQRTWAVYKDLISARRAASSPLAMELQVEYAAKGDTGMVHVEVVATKPLSFTRLQLRLAIIESGLKYMGETHDHTLRDYFPDIRGISFTIAQDDTFSHAEDFFIQYEDRGDKSSWVAENCRIVAFVQDDSTKEVVQAVQGPVVAPVPEGVDDLTITLAGEDLRLDWSPVMFDTDGNPLEVDLYRVYRDTLPLLGPGFDPFSSTAECFYVDHTGVVGDTGIHYYYAVTAVAGYKESQFSGLVGEMDKSILSGK